MAHLWGIIINLPEAVERRQRLLAQLKQLGLSEHYTWLRAQRGATNPEDRRGLTPGEDGLWRSVLQALQQPLPNKAHYLHILEDDAALSPSFCSWSHQLSPTASAEQLTFTDMYAGASVFQPLLRLAEQARSSAAQGWLPGTAYTGCTTSWLVHRQHIAAVERELRLYYQQADARIPLDNAIRRLLLAGQLTARICIPFQTSIDLGEQTSSQIQAHESQGIYLTRQLGAILRRRLSVLQHEDDLSALGAILTGLLAPEDVNEWLADRLVPHLKNREALRYRLDQRLLSEPGNPQAM